MGGRLGVWLGGGRAAWLDGRLARRLGGWSLGGWVADSGYVATLLAGWVDGRVAARQANVQSKQTNEPSQQQASRRARKETDRQANKHASN